MDLESALHQLRTGETAQQAEAAEAIAALGDGAQPAIPALVQFCGDDEESVRNWCVAALEEAGPPATSHLSDLANMAQAADSDVAFWAITMLGRAGSEAKDAIPVLLERLQDRHAPTVQERAAWALGRIGQGSEPVIFALEKVASHSGGPLAAQVQRALKRLKAA
ncbi:MAG: HEAT repeat domain-containing protein [Lacipirellulaceae bacterium]